MAYIPNVVGNTELNAATLNTIGQDIGVGVTVIQDNVQSLYTYGSVVLSNTSMTNKFYEGLTNKVVKPRLVDTMYRNKLSPLFKGVLDIGDGVEELLVPPAGVQKQPTDPSVSPNSYVSKADVYSAWHVVNAEMMYTVPVAQKRLRQAFTSFSALESFAQYLVDSLYNAYEWDSQTLTKFKAMQAIAQRKDTDATYEIPADIDSTTGEILDTIDFSEKLLTKARALSAKFGWMASDFNEAGLPVSTHPGDLYIIMTADAQALVDVNALASAFNLSYADFIGRRLVVDDFYLSDEEVARLQKITGLTGTAWSNMYLPIVTACDQVQAIICDANLFQIYDSHEPELWDMQDPALPGVDYYLHGDKVVGLSPFANCAVFKAVSD